MPVYIDKSTNSFGRMKMSHMIATDLGELHAMAQSIGLRREWFQDYSTPHYDVCQARKKMALKLGAIEIDYRQVVQLVNYWRIRKMIINGTRSRDCEHIGVEFNVQGVLCCLNCGRPFSQ